MWEEKLDFFKGEDFRNVVKELVLKRRKGIKVLPEKDNILRAFYATPFDYVKVVILAQDPYPNAEHACGLAFSIPENIAKLPPSLKNIYKELQSDLGIVRENGCLKDWASQGVLLLNTSLTVDEGKIDSHKKLGWNKLTKEVIQTLSTEKKHLVFILWGAKAQAYASFIENSEDHLVLFAPHPSPLSANRGFFGCKHFSQTNKYLKINGLTEIRW